MLLNGQCSNWSLVLAGVPQGSILGPLLVLMYMNDLPNSLESSVKLFADDTTWRNTLIMLHFNLMNQFNNNMI